MSVSKIGNLAALKALVAGLDILDQKQAPSDLETDSVKVVANLDMGSLVMEPITLVLLGPPLIGAADSVSWEIVGDGTGTFVNQNEFYQMRADRHVVLTEICLGVDYDALGLAADIAAGVKSHMFHYKSGPGSFSYNTTAAIEQWYFAQASRQEYYWSFPFWDSSSRNDPASFVSTSPVVARGPSSIFVQANARFNITVARDPIGNWPANTRFFGFAVGYAIPVGCKLPWM